MWFLRSNIVFQVEVDNYENRDHEVPYLTKNRQGMYVYDCSALH